MDIATFRGKVISSAMSKEELLEVIEWLAYELQGYKDEYNKYGHLIRQAQVEEVLGEHPDCGNHELAFKERTPEVFGGYEIWECVNDNCDYSESI